MVMTRARFPASRESLARASARLAPRTASRAPPRTRPRPRARALAPSRAPTRAAGVRAQDSFVLVCSDGVWDLFSPAEAVSFVARFGRQDGRARARGPAHMPGPALFVGRASQFPVWCKSCQEVGGNG